MKEVSADLQSLTLSKNGCEMDEVTVVPRVEEVSAEFQSLTLSKSDVCKMDEVKEIP